MLASSSAPPDDKNILPDSLRWLHRRRRRLFRTHKHADIANSADQKVPCMTDIRERLHQREDYKTVSLLDLHVRDLHDLAGLAVFVLHKLRKLRGRASDRL